MMIAYLKLITKNSQNIIRSLLAEVALNKADLPTAEHAYVMLKDYGGLQFCKRVSQIEVLYNIFTTINK